MQSDREGAVGFLRANDESCESSSKTSEDSVKGIKVELVHGFEHYRGDLISKWTGCEKNGMVRGVVHRKATWWPIFVLLAVQKSKECYSIGRGFL